ncbi:5-oxoprolinase/urea amidolyase family protein [Actinomadura welshii]
MLALYAALAAAPPPGVADIVPAARTLTLMLDPSAVPAAVAAAVRATRPGAADRAAGTAEIPVVYDGEDLGEVARRTGLTHAALGVGVSGAADPDSLALANRALGNPAGAAAVEVTFGGLHVRCRGGVFAAVTGAPAPLTIGGRAAAPYSVVHIPDGAELRLGPPPAGLRSYLAVRGGIDIPPVLGSRSTDTLSGLGPAPLRPGDLLPVGPPPRRDPVLDVLPVRPPPPGDLELRAVPGPRDDWFAPAALTALFTSAYTVTSEIDRVGMRLDGPRLTRAERGELPSEGTATGALQVPPSGRPVLFLADHPLTGGYPVIAVVAAADVGRAAQARPGQRLRFKAHPAPDLRKEDPSRKETP